MIKINILEPPSSHPLKFIPTDWYPLYINRRFFQDLNVNFSYHYQLAPQLVDCDYLFLSSRFFSLHSKSAADHTKTLASIASLKTSTNQLIWFDFRDSSGNTQFEVLPYVDLYLKNQLLQPLSTYQKSFYGHRVFTDFIHRRYHINDTYNDRYLPLDPTYIGKLKISWNPGLRDFRGGLKHHLALQTLTDIFESRRQTNHYLKFTPPTMNRPIDLLANFNTNYARSTVSWQRRHVNHLLPLIKNNRTILNQPLTLAQTIRYRRQAAIILSLFGWGELCSRDYQAWIAGSALIAPDTTHLTTWPVTHIPQKTYMPIKWDLSDLVSTYKSLINDKNLLLSIATQGQNTYRKIWSATGRQHFCTHFLQTIQ